MKKISENNQLKTPKDFVKDFWQNMSPIEITNDLANNFSKRLMTGMDDLECLLESGAKKIYFSSKRFLKRFFKR